MNIQNTPAYNNNFFSKTLNEQNFELEKVLEYFKNWHAITRAFGLKAPTYLALIASEIYNKETEKLIPLLQESTQIVLDDLGLYRGAKDGVLGPIHYKLFEELLDRQKTEMHKKTIHKETLELENIISCNFESVSGGFANICVVECIALRIIESLKNVCKKTKELEVKNWGYIDLHQELEVNHAGEAESIYKKYSDVVDNQKLDKDIETLITSFSNFWNKMFQVIS